MDEATKKEVEAMIAKARKSDEATGGKKKAVFVPLKDRVPNKPEYRFMSKAAVIEAERKRKETNLKLREMELQMQQEAKVAPAPTVETPKPEPEKPKGKPGRRPKKIE